MKKRMSFVIRETLCAKFEKKALMEGRTTQEYLTDYAKEAAAQVTDSELPNTPKDADK